MDIARRGFLRGRFRQFANLPRPPWARARGEFEAVCTRCDDCIGACPTHVIVRGDGGYPTVSFQSGECTFCAQCVSACKAGALRQEDDAAPWSLKAAISAACVTQKGVECRICGESCEAAAIRFRPTLGGIAQPQLDETACTGCGACVAPCPVGAVSVATPTETEQ